MSVIEEVRAGTSRRTQVCLLSIALDGIDSVESAEIRQLLYDPRYASAKSPDLVPSSGLSKAIRRRGYEVTDQMIRRHRRGLCSTCGQGAS